MNSGEQKNPKKRKASFQLTPIDIDSASLSDSESTGVQTEYTGSESDSETSEGPFDPDALEGVHTFESIESFLQAVLKNQRKAPSTNQNSLEDSKSYRPPNSS